MHKKIFRGDQQFKDGHKPIEHCCSKINKGLKCNTLIETNIQGEPKYRDEKGKDVTHKRLNIRTTIQVVALEVYLIRKEKRTVCSIYLRPTD